MVICVFGDSIACGFYDLEKGGWVGRLNYYLYTKHPGTDYLDLYNLSIDGDFTGNLLTRFQSELQARNPDMIILAIGINDAEYWLSQKKYQTQAGEFRKNLQKLYKTGRKFTSKIIFIGLTRVEQEITNPVSWDSNVAYFNKDILKYDKIIKDFCSKNGLQYIPMYDVLDNKDLFDGTHPNPAGHEKMFERIRSEIDAVIRNS